MKLQAVFVLSAIIATASQASAAVCTPEQAATIDGETDQAFETACPVLFTNSSSSVLKPNPTTTKEALKEIDGCKATTCTTYLTEVTDKTPDCEIEGVNVKGVYGTILTLCKKLATGSITDEELEKIFEDLIKNAGNLLEDGSQGTEEEVATNGTTTVPTSAPTSSNSNTTAPAAIKSSATTYFTGVAAIAAASIVSALVL